MAQWGAGHFIGIGFASTGQAITWMWSYMCDMCDSCMTKKGLTPYPHTPLQKYQVRTLMEGVTGSGPFSHNRPREPLHPSGYGA